MKSLFLNELNIHTDWKKFLTSENIGLITQIEKEIIKSEFTPSTEKVLRFLELPLSSIKVIILGQDPYPQEGVATGRAFEVGTLKSWNSPFKNISLKNILRAMYKTYTGEILKFNDIKVKLDNEFPVLPPQKLFKHWEKEGVLLLNTSFTCEVGSPGSHKKKWEEFSSRLLKFINDYFENISWFLWGNHAKNATSELAIKNRFQSQHPMMCFDGPNRDTDFLYGKINCFKALIMEIDWTGFKLKEGMSTSGTLF